MDILTQTGYMYWEWIFAFHPIFKAFLLRWACLLYCLLVLGLAVRRLYPTWITNTLAAQIIAISLSIIIMFSFPLDELVYIGKFSGNVLITIVILSWLILPHFIPRLIIRRRGLQDMFRILLYGLEFTLLIIQLISLAMR